MKFICIYTQFSYSCKPLNKGGATNTRENIVKTKTIHRRNYNYLLSIGGAVGLTAVENKAQHNM